VDSIGQGRVWSGEKALQLGLIDRIGGVQDALDCAARMAKLTTYRLHEYPEPENFLDLLLNNYTQSIKMKTIKADLGEQGASWYKMLSVYQGMSGVPQARIPFEPDLIP
jgi:protease-4